MLDGEGVERLWAWLNKAASSVKEMGASARRETIDDFCAFAAWRKIVRLRTYPLHLCPAHHSYCNSQLPISSPRRRDQAGPRPSRGVLGIRRAIEEPISAAAASFRQTNRRVGEGLQSTLPVHTVSPSYAAKPFILSFSHSAAGITLNEVRQAIAEEEERAARQAEIVATPGDSALSFVCSGLEIEAQQ